MRLDARTYLVEVPADVVPAAALSIAGSVVVDVAPEASTTEILDDVLNLVL